LMPKLAADIQLAALRPHGASGWCVWTTAIHEAGPNLGPGSRQVGHAASSSDSSRSSDSPDLGPRRRHRPKCTDPVRPSPSDSVSGRPGRLDPYFMPCTCSPRAPHRLRRGRNSATPPARPQPRQHWQRPQQRRREDPRRQPSGASCQRIRLWLGTPPSAPPRARWLTQQRRGLGKLRSPQSSPALPTCPGWRRWRPGWPCGRRWRGRETWSPNGLASYFGTSAVVMCYTLFTQPPL
jgi:hypothetical protein